VCCRPLTGNAIAADFRAAVIRIYLPLNKAGRQIFLEVKSLSARIQAVAKMRDTRPLGHVGVKALSAQHQRADVTE